MPFTLLSVVGALTCVYAKSMINLDHFPNPITDYTSCGRKSESFVCDPQNLVDAESTFVSLYYRYLCFSYIYIYKHIY